MMQACVSILDFAHTYQDAPKWERKYRRHYFPYDRDDQLSYSYNLGNGDFLRIYPKVGFSPFSFGPPLLPIIPNLAPISKGSHELTFSLEIMCQKDWMLDMTEIKVSQSDGSPVLPIGIGTGYKEILSLVYIKRDSVCFINTKGETEVLQKYGLHEYKFRFKTDTQDIQYFDVEIGGFSVNGVAVAIPTLHLERRKKLKYIPITGVFISR